MARLIDVDVLLEKLQEIANDFEHPREAVINLDALYDMIVDDIPTVAKDINVPGKWISVKDRLPAETHSIFWPWYGRKEWSNAMWREQSDKVLVTVTFKDGTRLVTTGETHDGEWHTSISKTLNPIVTHWMQMPEPCELPKEDT